MEVLAATKDRAGALAEYQRLRQCLARDLGIEPEPETQAAFFERLRKSCCGSNLAGPAEHAPMG